MYLEQETDVNRAAESGRCQTLAEDVIAAIAEIADVIASASQIAEIEVTGLDEHFDVVQGFRPTTGQTDRGRVNRGDVVEIVAKIAVIKAFIDALHSFVDGVVEL